MEKMNTARVSAHAKLNLTLDVTGTENGYHTLDSLVCSVDLADRIVARKRKDKLVNVYMRGMKSELIEPEQNNAYRAAEAFVSAFQTAGADITVYKNIPMGAGLGGSSADAAGVLNALSALYAVTDGGAVKSLADTLGSDTGYMLRGGFARLRGRGERVETVGACPVLHFLLICPQSGVSTAECFALSDTLSEDNDADGGHVRHTERALSALSGGDVSAFGASLGNALYPAAARLNPDAAQALKEARSFSPLGAGMTGSGSAAFALFETAELCEWAKSRYRGKFRVYCVKSVCTKKKTIRNPFALSEEERLL